MPLFTQIKDAVTHPLVTTRKAISGILNMGTSIARATNRAEDAFESVLKWLDTTSKITIDRVNDGSAKPGMIKLKLQGIRIIDLEKLNANNDRLNQHYHNLLRKENRALKNAWSRSQSTNNEVGDTNAAIEEEYASITTSSTDLDRQLDVGLAHPKEMILSNERYTVEFEVPAETPIGILDYGNLLRPDGELIHNFKIIGSDQKVLSNDTVESRTIVEQICQTLSLYCKFSGRSNLTPETPVEQAFASNLIMFFLNTFTNRTRIEEVSDDKSSNLWNQTYIMQLEQVAIEYNDLNIIRNLLIVRQHQINCRIFCAQYKAAKLRAEIKQREAEARKARLLRILKWTLIGAAILIAIAAVVTAIVLTGPVSWITALTSVLTAIGTALSSFFKKIFAAIFKQPLACLLGGTALIVGNKAIRDAKRERLKLRKAELARLEDGIQELSEEKQATEQDLMTFNITEELVAKQTNSAVFDLNGQPLLDIQADTVFKRIPHHCQTAHFVNCELTEKQFFRLLTELTDTTYHKLSCLDSKNHKTVSTLYLEGNHIVPEMPIPLDSDAVIHWQNFWQQAGDILVNNLYLTHIEFGIHGEQDESVWLKTLPDPLRQAVLPFYRQLVVNRLIANEKVDDELLALLSTSTDHPLNLTELAIRKIENNFWLNTDLTTRMINTSDQDSPILTHIKQISKRNAGLHQFCKTIDLNIRSLNDLRPALQTWIQDDLSSWLEVNGVNHFIDALIFLDPEWRSKLLTTTLTAHSEGTSLSDYGLNVNEIAKCLSFIIEHLKNSGENHSRLIKLLEETLTIKNKPQRLLFLFSRNAPVMLDGPEATVLYFKLKHYAKQWPELANYLSDYSFKPRMVHVTDWRVEFERILAIHLLAELAEKNEQYEPYIDLKNQLLSVSQMTVYNEKQILSLHQNLVSVLDHNELQLLVQDTLQECHLNPFNQTTNNDLYNWFVQHGATEFVAALLSLNKERRQQLTEPNLTAVTDWRLALEKTLSAQVMTEILDNIQQYQSRSYNNLVEQILKTYNSKTIYNSHEAHQLHKMMVSIIGQDKFSKLLATAIRQLEIYIDVNEFRLYLGDTMLTTNGSMVDYHSFDIDTSFKNRNNKTACDTVFMFNIIGELTTHFDSNCLLPIEDRLTMFSRSTPEQAFWAINADNEIWGNEVAWNKENLLNWVNAKGSQQFVKLLKQLDKIHRTIILYRYFRDFAGMNFTALLGADSKEVNAHKKARLIGWLLEHDQLTAAIDQIIHMQLQVTGWYSSRTAGTSFKDLCKQLKTHETTIPGLSKQIKICADMSTEDITMSYRELNDEPIMNYLTTHGAVKAAYDTKTIDALKQHMQTKHEPKSAMNKNETNNENEPEVSPTAHQNVP